MSADRADARAALVTGAGGVVGGAVVARLQAEGFAVAGLDLRGGGGDLPLAVDVADRGAVRAAAERARSELGTIEVLVTAHGYHTAAPFGEMRSDDWRRLLDTHLGGTVNFLMAFVVLLGAADTPYRPGDDLKGAALVHIVHELFKCNRLPHFGRHHRVECLPVPARLGSI